MKTINLLLIVFTVVLFTQCTEVANNKTEQEVEPKQEQEASENIKPFYQGAIVETIDAGGYTYMLIHENLEGHKHEEGHEHKDFWVAVTQTSAEIGDEVRFQKEMVAQNFYSKTLDRTFDEIMFASNLQHKVE